MTNTNMFVLVGNVTKDVDGEDFGYLPNGSARLNFSIAVNRSKKQGEEWVDEVSFFNIAYFGKPAESIKQYIGKGTKVCVSGYLKQNRWEKDGQKFSKVSFVAEQVELCGGRRDGENSNASAPSQTFKPANNAPVDNSFDDGSGFDANSFNEQIPF